MSYSGTTAATSSQNPPIQLVKGLGNIVNTAGAVAGSTAQPLVGGNAIWYYQSTDGCTYLQAAGYFSDGLGLGMRNGDLMLGVAASSVGSTTVTAFVGVLLTTNSTNGFNIATGGAIQSS